VLRRSAQVRAEDQADSNGKRRCQQRQHKRGL